MYKHINFDENKDAQLIERLQQESNITAYIKKLIQDDINREQNKKLNEKTFIEEEVKRRYENYTQTKTFKNRIKEVLKDEDIKAEIDKYIAKEIKKQMSIIENLLKK